MQNKQWQSHRKLFVSSLIILPLAFALAGCSVASPPNATSLDSLRSKNLSAAWIQSLTQRSAPQKWSGDALQNIGMPIGGIGAGQMYLGGDGRLWLWDIFNIPRGTYGEHYAHPLQEASAVSQGFAIRIKSGGTTETRTLDNKGFAKVVFTGQYPIGYVDYSDPSCLLNVKLEAFSPFIPLEPEKSAVPATILRYTVKNTSDEPVTATLGGWLQNAVCSSDTSGAVSRTNGVVRDGSLLFVNATAEGRTPTPPPPGRSDTNYQDFEASDYGQWTVTGNAFGTMPSRGNGINQNLTNFSGKGLVNSYGPTNSDAATGTLTSPSFTISRQFITFLIGGGNYANDTCINLLVSGKVVRTSAGDDTDALKQAVWYVGDLEGKQAQIQIIDNATGGWGHIDIDNITFTDMKPPQFSADITSRPDYGSMGLALLNALPNDRAVARMPDGDPQKSLFHDADPSGTSNATALSNQDVIGSIQRQMTLAPGQSKTVTFAVTWFFPNLTIPGLHDPGGRHYANFFTSATGVAQYLNANIDDLSTKTELWHDTWYDSTLPYWFLDRTFANTSSMATSAEYWMKSGRFYAWEGVGFCPGNCTHVYEYAQAAARLFPSIERDERQRIDYGIGFHPDSGLVGFRAEYDMSEATDGQAGIILRTYREYQMSANSAFLVTNWPSVKKAMQYLIAKDPGQSGILSDGQPNTLDTTWYGEIPWISSLYIASLRAAHAMASIVGDKDFAQQTEAIADRGTAAFDAKMWNGDYFQQQVDPAHANATGAGDGCEIDQVLGQSWAFQVGLPRVIDREHTLKALDALWQNNYFTDVGPYIATHSGGRPFALPGEAGVVMCTFPKNSEQDRLASTTGWQAKYFNECMSGFEHALASEMIDEGMTLRGLAIEKSINDRYSAEKRNPYNEVEAGDHYGRAMASYGVFLAASGYEYDGPRGYLAFAPRISPERFKAAFTSAEGWGSFSQSESNGKFQADIAVRFGRTKLRSLELAPPNSGLVKQVAVTLGTKSLKTSFQVDGDRIKISLPSGTVITAGQIMHVVIR